MEKNIDSNIVSNIVSNVESNMEKNIDSNIESNVESIVESNMEKNIENNLESNMEKNIENNLESSIETHIFSKNKAKLLPEFDNIDLYLSEDNISEMDDSDDIDNIDINIDGLSRYLPKLNNYIDNSINKSRKSYLDEYMGYITKQQKLHLNNLYYIYKYNVNFQKELEKIYQNYLARPSHLYYAQNLSKYCKYGKIWIKREDLIPTGDSNMVNIIGYCLIAKYHYYKNILIDSKDGYYGVLIATACSILQIQCTVYMTINDIEQYKENVLKIKLLGGKIKPIYDNYTQPLIQCMKDWVKDSVHSICLSNISNELKLCFNTIIGREIYLQSSSLGINNTDIIILNNKYDYQKYSALDDFYNITYVSSNIDTIYINDTIIVDYIKSSKIEIIDSINLLALKEGIFCSSIYGKSIFCAIKMAQNPSSLNKNIILHI